jgi:hypothetical protein
LDEMISSRLHRLIPVARSVSMFSIFRRLSERNWLAQRVKACQRTHITSMSIN